MPCEFAPALGNVLFPLHGMSATFLGNITSRSSQTIDIVPIFHGGETTHCARLGSEL